MSPGGWGGYSGDFMGSLQGDVRVSFREAFGGVVRGGVLGSFVRGVVRGGFREVGEGAGPWLPAPLKHEMIFCWNLLFFLTNFHSNPNSKPMSPGGYSDFMGDFWG